MVNKWYFSVAKIRCHCDGNLVEQLPCSNSQRTEAVVTNRSSTTNTAIVPAPAITWRGTTAPSDSLMSTGYRSDLATCQWSQWGLWSVCSVSCGTGEIIRKRICPCRYGFGQIEFYKILKHSRISENFADQNQSFDSYNRIFTNGRLLYRNFVTKIWREVNC